MFIAQGTLKFTEEDDYQNGCNPESSQTELNCLSFESDTIQGLVMEIKEFFEVTADDVLLNSCDEVGRLDVQRMENSRENKPGKKQIEAWQKEQCKLYAALYSFEVTKIEAVDLVKELTY